MDLNTISIIVSIIVVGFLLERRIDSRIDDLRQEMYRLFEQHSSQLAALHGTAENMQESIIELQKGQARIEGAFEVIKDLFERAMFSSSERT